MTYLIPQLPASGGVTLSSSWRFSTTTAAADPGTRTLRYDNATPANVLNLYINDTTNEGGDASTILGLLVAGNRIYVQQQDDAANATLFELTGPAVDNTGWWTVPVSVVSTLALPVNNKSCVVIMNLGSVNAEPVVANHVRAGNRQVVDGSVVIPFFSWLTIPQGTWESVGPTGSGATNIYDEMDVIPANATMVIFTLNATAIADNATLGLIDTHWAKGGITPLVTFASGHRLEGRGSASGDGVSLMREIVVPIDSNRVFQARFDVTDCISFGATVYYKGFITD